MLITNLSQIAGYDIACAYGMVSTTASMTKRVLKTSMGGARSAHESGADGFSAELERFSSIPNRQGFPNQCVSDSCFLPDAGGRHGWDSHFRWICAHG